MEQVKKRKERKFQALSKLDALRRKLESRVGVYPGNPIAEVRAERERQVEALLSPRVRDEDRPWEQR